MAGLHRSQGFSMNRSNYSSSQSSASSTCLVGNSEIEHTSIAFRLPLHTLKAGEGRLIAFLFRLGPRCFSTDTAVPRNSGAVKARGRCDRKTRARRLVLNLSRARDIGGRNECSDGTRILISKSSLLSTHWQEKLLEQPRPKAQGSTCSLCHNSNTGQTSILSPKRTYLALCIISCPCTLRQPVSEWSPPIAETPGI